MSITAHDPATADAGSRAAPALSRPEILAPAGDHDALRAALAAGADAVYFGLDDGFNARARAKNFAVDDLDDIVRACHRAGARAYLTLNTLVFEEELPEVEAILRRVGASGVDALIVQDPAVCLLARRVCPELELHASTQMTISSPEAARFAACLGVTRVVVPRELSLDQIRAFRAACDLELEVFIHGALCMSWSGQCLTSEAWGGRSANRGQCAQSCRLPYGLVVDGADRDLGEVRYLLSPRDLAGHDAAAELAAIGVHTLKIEGRLKGPAYVMTAVQNLRRHLAPPDLSDPAGLHDPASPTDPTRDVAVAEMERVFSRGFSVGFLNGTDHQRLVDGRHPKHRGAFLGRVAEVRPLPAGDEVVVHVTDDFPRAAPLIPTRGMGVVFDLGDPQDAAEPGAALFDVAPLPGPRPGFVLRFARDPGLAPDLRRVAPGHRVWVNSDPTPETRALRLVKAAPPSGRVPATLTVAGALGEPLRARLAARDHAVDGVTALPLRASEGGPGLTPALLADKLGALGGTPFALTSLDATALPEGLFVPPGALKALRRELVTSLEGALERGRPRAVDPEPAVAPARAALAARARARLSAGPHVAGGADGVQLVPLCRLDAQLDAVIAAGLPEVELDWMEFVGLGRAAARARAAGLRVTLATPRIQAPGEDLLDQRIARLAPDAVLVRHWGGLMHFASRAADTADAERPLVHGDFSLNVTNSLTFWHLIGLGLDTVTASHDLDERQLFGLVAEVDPARLAVVVHHHIPTFHTEHCVYAHLLSDGRDYRDCGRPCEAHAVSLRDPKGLEHPVIVDVSCRNTVFEARAQSAATLVPRLIDAGVRRLRVELVRESAAETAEVLAAYGDLIAGRATPREVVRRVGVHEQFGVVRGVASSARGAASP